MTGYILKRILLSIPMLIGITFISFIVMQLAPGDAGTMGNGESSANQLTQQQYDVMNESFHFGQPMHMRYLYWLGVVQPEPTASQLKRWNKEDEDALAAGLPAPSHKQGLIYLDFGHSMETHSFTVWQRLREALPITILLNVISIFLIYTIAIPIGIYSATHQYSAADRISTVGLFMLFSMPSFWVAVLLIKLMVVLPAQWRLPFHGVEPGDSSHMTTLAYLYESAKHLVLPVVAMSYAGLAQLSRYMRSSMIDIIRADFVKMARAKGLPEFYVIYKHALRNSLIPIITLLAGLLPGLIGGSVIIESIFGVPGMGNLGYQALLSRDYTILMALNTIVAVLVMIGFLLSDILYVVADPRIKFAD